LVKFFDQFFGAPQALNHWPNVVRLGDSCQQLPGISQTKSPSKPKRTTSSRFLNESKPGVFTSTKALLDRDKDIVKKILKGVQLRRPVEVQTALLRRYFLELTQVFRNSASQ
jgi:hypothetical protein